MELKDLNVNSPKEVLDSITLDDLYYKCKRITLEDGQEIKDMDHDVFVKIYYKYMDLTNAVTYTETEISKRLCNIMDYFIEKYVDSKKKYKFLDIGCADGRCIDHVSKKYSNITTNGCEIDEKWISYCNNKGRDVFFGDISKMEGFSKVKYDIVLAAKCLQFVKNYKEGIINVMKLVKKNGYGIIINGFSADAVNHYCLIDKPIKVKKWFDDGMMKGMELIEYLESEQTKNIVPPDGWKNVLANDEAMFIIKKV